VSPRYEFGEVERAQKQVAYVTALERVEEAAQHVPLHPTATPWHTELYEALRNLEQYRP
jgi:hypothetical protein